MKKIIIDPSSSTPEVLFDYEAGKLQIKGVCTPENPRLFFEPIFKALDEYQKEQSQLVIEICLDYFNTGSSKCLLNIFNIISNNSKLKVNTTINWIIEEHDTDIKESGVLFEEITGLKFNYVNTNWSGLFKRKTQEPFFYSSIFQEI